MEPETCQAQVSKFLKNLIKDLKECFYVLYLSRDEDYPDERK